MRPLITLAGLALILATSASHAQPSGTSRTIEPLQAIQLAGKAAPRGVRGTFSMLVQATGSKNGHVFLNSEKNYRDQTNLTIDIAPWVARSLEQRLGASPEKYFKGKTVTVKGTARRVTIRVLDDYHRPTDVYYFQTHVPVMNVSQILAS